MTLDDILNTYAIDLEASGVKFKLKPFTTDQIQEWNAAQTLQMKPEETQLEFADRRNKSDLEVVAKHMKACADGAAKSVTAAWLSKVFPQAVLTDLLNYFLSGKKPVWAGVEGK